MVGLAVLTSPSGTDAPGSGHWEGSLEERNLEELYFFRVFLIYKLCNVPLVTRFSHSWRMRAGRRNSRLSGDRRIPFSFLFI